MSEPTLLTHIGFRRAIYNANLQKFSDMESISRKKNQRNTRLFHFFSHGEAGAKIKPIRKKA